MDEMPLLLCQEFPQETLTSYPLRDDRASVGGGGRRSRRPRPETPDEFMRRYPRVTAHLIAESLGYFTPSAAARAGLDAIHGRENWCEYIYTCFDRNPRPCLERAIKARRCHSGYMAEYRLAKRLVDRCLETGREPMFASWF
ncbi:MAG: hypothetical protein AB1512_02805 [Thermodesulfobacteriota bacterium]